MNRAIRKIASVFIVLALLGSCQGSSGEGGTDIFTALDTLVKLVDTQTNVAKYFRSILTNEKKKIKEAEEILQDFEFLAVKASENPEKFVGNPMNSYLLIRKLTRDFKMFFALVDSSDILKDIEKEMQQELLLPTGDDLVGAAIALNRLEDTYELDPTMMREDGLSDQYPLARRLTHAECFDIAQIAYTRRDFYHAVRWAVEALRATEFEEISKQDEILYLDYLSFSTFQRGNVYYALQLTQRMLDLDPSHERAKSNLIFYQKELDVLEEKFKAEFKEKDTDYSLDPYTYTNKRTEKDYGYSLGKKYEALCRGEADKLPPNRTKLLKCRYVRYHPLLYIAPVKEEQIHDEPPIWIYYDVISEDQIKQFKQLGGAKLRRAIVRNPQTGKYETADYRISKSGWLDDSASPFLPYLTSLVSAVTNLTLKTAEEWQIANYGLGGQYDPHYDFARSKEPSGAFDVKIGNRIATWLFYLEVPEKGGATIFRPIGVHVKPVRRAAIFWYNLLPSGEGDYRTKHAACPVLFGSKWVSNKWIHERGQEFKRPCNLIQEKIEELES